MSTSYFKIDFILSDIQNIPITIPTITIYISVDNTTNIPTVSGVFEASNITQNLLDRTTTLSAVVPNANFNITNSTIFQYSLNSNAYCGFAFDAPQQLKTPLATSTYTKYVYGGNDQNYINNNNTYTFSGKINAYDGNTDTNYNSPTGYISTNTITEINNLPTPNNICFPSGTPIKTDQGNIPIEKIDPDIHTIDNKNIVAITKTISTDAYLVVFEKNSIEKDYPNERTVISKQHKILYQGKMVEAYKFIEKLV